MTKSEAMEKPICETCGEYFGDCEGHDFKAPAPEPMEAGWMSEEELKNFRNAMHIDSWRTGKEDFEKGTLMSDTLFIMALQAIQLKAELEEAKAMIATLKIVAEADYGEYCKVCDELALLKKVV